MQLQVQIPKKLSIEVLHSQIESVKGELISYTLIDKGNYYALNLTYKSVSVYTDFMERLHSLWRDKPTAVID